MKYSALLDIAPFAQVQPIAPQSNTMTRRERLLRFADLLEQCDRPIKLLSRVEYLSERAQQELRDDASPLAVAFGDPTLRAQGLESDRLGDVRRFFGLSARDAHHLFCDCHYLSTPTARAMATRIRSLADPRMRHGMEDAGVWTRICAVARNLFGTEHMPV